MCHGVTTHWLHCDVRPFTIHPDVNQAGQSPATATAWFVLTIDLDRTAAPVACSSDGGCPTGRHIPRWFRCEYGHACCYMRRGVYRCGRDCDGVISESHDYEQHSVGSHKPWAAVPLTVTVDVLGNYVDGLSWLKDGEQSRYPLGRSTLETDETPEWALQSGWLCVLLGRSLSIAEDNASQGGLPRAR